MGRRTIRHTNQQQVANSAWPYEEYGISDIAELSLLVNIHTPSFNKINAQRAVLVLSMVNAFIAIICYYYRFLISTNYSTMHYSPLDITLHALKV